MKKNIVKTASAVFLTTILSTGAMANDIPQLGLGVGVTGDTTTLRGTVELDNSLRLEPYFGFSYKNPDNANSRTNLEIGSAIQMQQAITNKISGYYGGFVGVGSHDDGTGTITTFNFGPVAGVEYALEKQFTLGAEVRLNIGLGDATEIGTNSAVLVRYYF